tara:strand:+ start:211 stop:1875 length:1665 start_codon:yes stop_codon:yes gene_type:complete
MAYIGKSTPISVEDTVSKSAGGTFGGDVDVTGALTVDTITVDTSTLVVDKVNNRVGINTTSPGYPLQVNGSVDILNVKGSTGNAFVRFTDSDATADFSIGADDGSNAGSGAFILYDRTNSEYRLTVDSNGRMSIGDLSGGVSGGPKLWVQSIRTTNFSASDYNTWADVLVRNATNDSTCATGIGFITDGENYANGASGIAAISDVGDTESSLAFITRPLNVVATERMRISSAGNVGINTTSPGYKLQVDHGTAAQYASSIRNTADNLQLLLGTTTGGLLNIQGKTISSNAAYQITLQAEGGDVGIGETSPSNILHIKTSASGGPQIELDSTSGTANSAFINFDGTSLQLSTQRDMVNGSKRDTSKSWGGINIVGAAAGSYIQLQTSSGNNNSVSTKMEISKDGEISTPNQPIGYRRNVSTSNTWITLNGNAHNIFNNWYTPAAWQQNSGANTIDDSGRFYAPVAGWYLVNPEIYSTTGSNSSPYGYANVYKNGSNQFGGHIINYGGDTNDKMNSHSVAVYMTNTDYVQIGVYVAQTGSFQVYSPYSGYWVYFLG